MESPVRGTKKGFSMFRKSLTALALLACATVAAHAADTAKGKIVYKRCAVCHTDDKAGGDGLGPNLFGIVGRKAALRPGFSYSAPLTKAGIVWNKDNLIKWIAGPGRMVPGTKMAFAGVTSKSQDADLVAYLATLK
jgi:cytochrome c